MHVSMSNKYYICNGPKVTMGVRVAPLAATIPLPCDASLYGEVGGKGRQLSELLSCAKSMRLPRVGVPPAPKLVSYRDASRVVPSLSSQSSHDWPK